MIGKQGGLSRRRALRLAVVAAAGTAGAAVLAACGETKAVSTAAATAAPAEKAVTTVAPVGTAAAPAAAATAAAAAPKPGIVQIRFVTDHTAGPRGKAMQWGMAKFSELRPDVFVKLEPVADLIDSLAIQFAAGTAPHVALLSQSDFIRFKEQGAFTEISGVLTKSGLVKTDYYFITDAYTDNKIDHSFPQPMEMQGPQYGMPFQTAINGFLANINIAEAAGVTLPASEGSWTWADWTEFDKKMTNVDKGLYGTWARDDYEFQYMPQMYSNGLKKPFNDSLTKTMYDLPESVEAFKYLVDKIYVHKTSPLAEQTKAMGGEFGDPFNAGKIGIWASGRVYSTGFSNPVIKDRFKYTLLPEVEAKKGMPPGHSWNDQPNLVTNAAARTGTEEQSAALALFLASELYQGRVGIDRGHMPVHKKAMAAPDSMAPPPEGMKWLKVYADRTDKRSLYPFSSWREWFLQTRALLQKAWVGEQKPEQAMEAAQAWGVRHLSGYTGPKPFVKTPVYP